MSYIYPLYKIGDNVIFELHRYKDNDYNPEIVLSKGLIVGIEHYPGLPDDIIVYQLKLTRSTRSKLIDLDLDLVFLMSNRKILRLNSMYIRDIITIRDDLYLQRRLDLEL